MYVLLLFLLWSSRLTAAQIRDLRKIDSRIPNLVPTILVRKESILVNILHLRALSDQPSKRLLDADDVTQDDTSLGGRDGEAGLIEQILKAVWVPWSP